ncbi:MULTISPECIES: TetR/AcrR family transcriptional regulator [unclassified Rathayibacter]|uniref:TetR/AcrR family transcriptional regulator n=2 Tax=unclassified Rathayibacter TaxID=2609250 RepID=UPI001FB356F8|nr:MULTISPECIES: TetR/AcrR family transcriptional regulator [unclassified Rathayibacter]MCJ1671967.1 TetR/AcrR family transcriptional regulator [Rathayibacter sp. VKM Ac-2929]MCJ1683863.1 TetR/AcrR family transcriptional regulator [Rathayibacter sp. VKM Ac-2928]
MRTRNWRTAPLGRSECALRWAIDRLRSRHFEGEERLMAEAGTTRSARRGPYAKSAERRRAIIEAAHAVFAARGYARGSLQDVADRVGLSQTSLLHYFPSKTDLLLAVLQHRDRITGDGSTPVDPEEGLVEGIVRQTRYNETAPGVIELYAVLCGESTTDEHPGRDFFASRFQRLRADYAGQLRELRAAGRLREGADPDRVAASIIALWDGIQLQWLLENDAVDMVACLTDYLDLMILPAP